LADLSAGRQSRSARISISLPPELHHHLLRLSERQQRSLSNLCVVLLASAVEQHRSAE
jgi:hypothetical protein